MHLIHAGILRSYSSAKQMPIKNVLLEIVDTTVFTFLMIVTATALKIKFLCPLSVGDDVCNE